ncbi:hypothetical protein Q427_34015 [Halomonas sp. BC04]|nr:hypothetical protein Q427_34015 [Halomonas sp. BC04]
MDYSIVFEAIKPLWWVLPIVVLLGIFKSRWFKGLFGEAYVKLIARLRLPAEEYQGVHDVTLPTPDGTTQIDHVLVSRYGIFVIETKHMMGWIFGSEKQPQWTQKIYRKTFKFQNPLRQNYKHVKALAALLDVPADTIYSVVVFSGSAVFKTRMPDNVTIGGGYVRYIKSFRDPVLSDTQVQEVLESITTGRLRPIGKRTASMSNSSRPDSSPVPSGPARSVEAVWYCARQNGARMRAIGSGVARPIPSAVRCRM